MRKIFFASFFLMMAIFLSGCGSSTAGNKPTMDELAEDDKYHYQNPDLGFQVALPSSFEYYQTQKKETDGYTDIEFFVPTSDESNSFSEVAGYAKPMTVRIFDKEEWKNIDEEGRFQKIDENGDSVYTVHFWDDIPADWQDKWGENTEAEIEKSFEF
ncbi:MAG: hypothetical protein ACOCVY_01395 [Patescibacteria group bacterium]